MCTSSCVNFEYVYVRKLPMARILARKGNVVNLWGIVQSFTGTNQKTDKKQIDPLTTNPFCYILATSKMRT